MEPYCFYIPDITYFSYCKCNSNWEIKKSFMQYHNITYVVKGKGTYCINDEKVEVKAGDIIYISSQSTCQAETSKESFMEFYSINFFLVSVYNIDNNSRIPFDTVNYIGIQVNVISLYEKLGNVWQQKADMYKLDARAIFLEIFYKLVRCVVLKKVTNVSTEDVIEYDRRVEVVKAYINDNFHLPLNVSELAKMVGLNDVYLGALFKKIEGVTLKNYINMIRIHYAHNMLLTETVTVSDVAFRCGFSDPFYFSRVFKRYKGYQPSKIHKKI